MPIKIGASKIEIRISFFCAFNDFQSGISYISNPDFVERLKNNVVLQAPNPETFFGVDAVGFTDYAFA